MDCWWWNELFITTVPDVPTDQPLLASPGVCWQHILTSMDDAPLFRHLHNPVTAFSIDSETCFTFMFVWMSNSANRKQKQVRTHCPKAILACRIFFLAYSLHSLALGLTQIVTDSLCCHYLLIAEHTNLASLRRATKENLDSWVFGMSLILAAVMPGT